jgi:tripeptidyl-peptidase-1
MKKRGVAERPRPLITQLPGYPHPNSSVCDIYVTAECTRGSLSRLNAGDSDPNNVGFSAV